MHVSVPLEVIVWLLLAVCTFTDLRWGKIYNWVTVPVFLSGFLFQLFLFPKQAFLGPLVGFALFLPLYALKVVSAGDVKLMVALGAWTPAPQLVQISFLAILLGAGVGGSVLLWLHLRNARKANRHGMAFAPAVFCAFLLVQVAHLKGWSGW